MLEWFQIEQFGHKINAFLINILNMFGKIIMAGMLTVAFSLSAKSPVVLPLWNENRPPVESGLTPDNEIMENEGWISMVATPELTVYPADNPNGMALLMCPGGGYYGVAIQHEGKALAAPLNKEGVTVAVLKYRMPNGHHEVPADDVHRAMEILASHASEWGIDPMKIGIGGASAGGHLASTVATHPVAPGINPAFQVLLYPVISMKEGVTHQGSREGLLGKNPSEELVELYSNELQVTKQTPPAFIAVSADDDVVPVKNSIQYFNALVENGVSVSLHIYPSGSHGWGYSPEFVHNEMWFAELLHWLNNLSLPSN